MAKNKFKTGTKELDADEFDPKNTKVRISIIMEGDLLDALKTEAINQGIRYQTLMKKLVRKGLNLDDRIQVSSVDAADLLARIETLEKAAKMKNRVLPSRKRA